VFLFSQNACSRNHSPGYGAGIPFLQRSSPGPRFPVSLPYHDHCLQLLFLHVPGASQLPVRVSSWLVASEWNFSE